MVEPSKIFGRLGNSLFQYAFLYARTREMGIDYYVQDPELFESYKEEIRALFGTGITPINQVSIHVRRGDYVNNPFYVDLTETDYYDRAIAEFPHDTFVVFSDDIEWCKNYFKGEQFEFSEGNNEIEDINLMAGCKAHIMANSSFSWWASYLSGNKTVAPVVWHPDGVERTKCLPEWKRI